jgi:hypothetical protein
LAQLPHTLFWADCITNTREYSDRRAQPDSASLLAFKDIELMAKDQVLGH